MSLLFETIKVKDGCFLNLPLHMQRMNYSRKMLLHSKNPIPLENMLTIPDNFQYGIYKCKVEYDFFIHSISFSAYNPKNIKTLQLVHADSIMYNYKFSDRSLLEDLKNKANADEIIIVKNGLITDTSFSNIIFYDGEKWITPSTPLLEGTMRKKLLQEKKIVKRKIQLNDLKNFRKIKLINAMRDMDDEDVLINC